MERLQKIINNEYIRGGFLLTITNVIISFLNYLFNLLAGRVLGPAGYGDIAALFSYLYITSVPIAVMSNVIIQKIGLRSVNQKSYVRSLEKWFILNLKKWWYLIIPFACFSLAVPGITHLSRAPGYLLTPLIVITFIMSFYNASLNGLRVFIYVAVIGVIATIIKFFGPFLEISIFSRLGTITTLFFLSQLFSLFASWYVLKKNIGKKDKDDEDFNKNINSLIKNKGIWLIGFSMLGITLFNNLDVIFVKQLLSQTDAGIYCAWSLFAKMIYFVIAPISGVAFVFFASNKNKRLGDILVFGYIIVLIIVGLCGFIVFQYFGDLVTKLMFGTKFNAVIPYLGMAAVFGSGFSMVQFLNNFFMAKNSKYSLLVPMLTLLYFIILLVYGHNITQVMYADIVLGVTGTIVTFGAYLSDRKNLV